MPCCLVKILELMIAPIIAAILAGLFFKILEDIKALRELVAVLLALKNECSYNSIHRGNEQSQFQLYWLERASSMLAFYEYCPALTAKCHETYELAKDANCGQLKRRKLVPKDVQDQMSEISFTIEKIWPELKKLTKFSFFAYLFQ